VAVLVEVDVTVGVGGTGVSVIVEVGVAFVAVALIRALKVFTTPREISVGFSTVLGADNEHDNTIERKSNKTPKVLIRIGLYIIPPFIMVKG
jgi:hypothetical protein